MKIDQLKPLLSNHASRHDEMTQQDLRIRLRLLGQAVSKLESQFTERDVHDSDSYYYIPVPPTLFIEVLIEAFFVLGAQKGKRFLDVGCGVGTTVLLAQTLFDAYGLDYNPDLIAKASFMVGDHAFQADANEYNQYGDFDFVYYYRPFYDEWQFLEFEKSICRALKPGAVVCPLWQLYDWEHAPNMEQVGEFIYQRIPSKQ